MYLRNVPCVFSVSPKLQVFSDPANQVLLVVKERAAFGKGDRNLIPAWERVHSLPHRKEWHGNICLSGILEEAVGSSSSVE